MVEGRFLADILHFAKLYSNCPYGFVDVLNDIEAFPPNAILDPHDFVVAGFDVGVPCAEVLMFLPPYEIVLRVVEGEARVFIIVFLVLFIIKWMFAVIENDWWDVRFLLCIHVDFHMHLLVVLHDVEELVGCVHCLDVPVFYECCEPFGDVVKRHGCLGFFGFMFLTSRRPGLECRSRP